MHHLGTSPSTVLRAHNTTPALLAPHNPNPPPCNPHPDRARLALAGPCELEKALYRDPAIDRPALARCEEKGREEQRKKEERFDEATQRVR